MVVVHGDLIVSASLYSLGEFLDANGGQEVLLERRGAGFCGVVRRERRRRGAAGASLCFLPVGCNDVDLNPGCNSRTEFRRRERRRHGCCWNVEVSFWVESFDVNGSAVKLLERCQSRFQTPRGLSVSVARLLERRQRAVGGLRRGRPNPALWLLLPRRVNGLGKKSFDVSGKGRGWPDTDSRQSVHLHGVHQQGDKRNEATSNKGSLVGPRNRRSLWRR